jgi:hypothetical protein
MLAMKLPDTWTVIAESQYTGVQGSGFSRWVSLPESPWTVPEARGMYMDGKLLMAQKRLPSGLMGLVVKAKANSDG